MTSESVLCRESYLTTSNLGQVRLVKAVQSELCSADRQTKD